ncbi:hypothetical protein Q3G72_018190 [Acer saccharum]|nr:hypothetical protein Q3G72_018190 [Acer saccharum]
MGFWILSLLCFRFHYYSCTTSAELITALPGQPTNVSFKQHSGYINVTDAHHGRTRALFYYFVEAQSPDPVSLPLTLWLNGESNMLYVESPIGVGFSYSNTSSDYILWNDTRTAEDNLRFIVKWLEEFPQYEDSDFFLTGESYAGHYIPQLASLLMEYNKQPNIIRPIKLKAIALGNPLLDLDISVLSGEYLWSHGAISDETLRLEKKVCNDSKYLHEFVHKQRSQECNNVFKRVSDEVGDDIDRTDLLSPLCLPASFTQQFKAMGKHGEIHSKAGGWSQSFGRLRDGKNVTYLTFATVRGAAHEVPFTSPSQALTLFRSFLAGSPLPRPN